MAFREIDDEFWAIIEPHLPPQKPHVGRPRTDHRAMFNGILDVLTIGYTWSDVPRQYGTKSTVHRFHLYLAEQSIYQDMFLDLLRSGYEIRKTRKIRDFPDRKLQSSFRVDLTHCSTDTKDIPAKKGDRSVMMAIRK
ncbi:MULTISPECIES: transposase [unclassified Methanoculleus]|jgi:transposase|uniref:transposase n=1 Tax=unclassified Methanoculleus TaxID=2619537 RepID=UPI00319E934E